MNVTECIRSQKRIFKYRTGSFVHSFIIFFIDFVMTGVSISSSRAATHIPRYIAIEFSSILASIAEKSTPYYNSRINRLVPVLTAGNFSKDLWI